MNAKKRLSVGATVAVVALFGSAMIGGTAQAQKKKKTKTVTVTKAINQAIPDAVLVGAAPNTVDYWGKLRTDLFVSKKKAKNTTVDQLAVTLQTTGLAAGAAGDLQGRPDLPVRDPGRAVRRPRRSVDRTADDPAELACDRLLVRSGDAAPCAAAVQQP